MQCTEGSRLKYGPQPVIVCAVRQAGAGAGVQED
jgi:hypothetical protein